MRNISIEEMEQALQNEQQSKVKTSVFDAKNYLNVKLDKGQTEKELRIRLLPVSKDTNLPFQKIHTHTVKVPKEISPNGWKSYVCLKKTEAIDKNVYGNKCPFCEANYQAYLKTNEVTDLVEKSRWDEIKKANNSHESCILRVIERGHEEDGPKFWKFNLRNDGKDPWNIIYSLYKTRMQESIDEGEEPLNILDVYNGKDLKVIIKEVVDASKNKKTSIEVVDYGKVKPLSEDEKLAEKWLNDEKTWSDVFSIKTYDYLSIILDGEIPFYDKNEQKWVVKGDLMKEKSDANEIANLEIKSAEEAILKQTTEYVEDNNNEEIPF